MLETGLNNYLFICTLLGIIGTTSIVLMSIITLAHEFWIMLKRVFKRLVRKLYFALYE